MQEVAEDREGLTLARMKIRGVEVEMPTGIQKAPPTTLPPIIRVSDVSVQVEVLTQREQPLLVKA